MLKKTTAIMITFLAVTACSSSSPRIIQSTSDMPEIRLIVGKATQIEMPDSGRVQSVTVGNPALVTAEQSSDVVNLIAKGGAGETNLIIRSREDDSHVKVYQYNITVQER